MTFDEAGDTGITIPAADQIAVRLEGRQVATIRKATLDYEAIPERYIIPVSEPGTYVIIKIEQEPIGEGPHDPTGYPV